MAPGGLDAAGASCPVENPRVHGHRLEGVQLSVAATRVYLSHCEEEGVEPLPHLAQGVPVEPDQLCWLCGLQDVVRQDSSACPVMNPGMYGHLLEGVTLSAGAYRAYQDACNLHGVVALHGALLPEEEAPSTPSVWLPEQAAHVDLQEVTVCSTVKPSGNSARPWTPLSRPTPTPAARCRALAGVLRAFSRYRDMKGVLANIEAVCVGAAVEPAEVSIAEAEATLARCGMTPYMEELWEELRWLKAVLPRTHDRAGPLAHLWEPWEERWIT